MNNALYNFPVPQNEPLLDYLKNSAERLSLESELARQSEMQVDIPIIIGGKEIRTGDMGEIRMPHRHAHILATYHKVGEREISLAIESALQAHHLWSNLTWTIRASILLKAAFEYQGQKCSAASRMYVPKSLWPQIKPLIVDMANDIKMGDVTDMENFMNAVIDKGSYDTIRSFIEYAKKSENARIIAGGECDDTEGYFISPTIIETDDPKYRLMEEEIFGPVLTVYVYEDSRLEEILELCDTTSPYGLTGAVFARDRVAASRICERLRYAAGNFYINDKPTGAIVGLQPFGGSRASGTNDKAGGEFNLVRWISPRTIKETFVPATDYKYPYMTE